MARKGRRVWVSDGVASALYIGVDESAPCQVDDAQVGAALKISTIHAPAVAAADSSYCDVRQSGPT